jgi:hypothetical protein
MKFGFRHQFSNGFCIPFLRIQDFKKNFDSKVNEMTNEHELHKFKSCWRGYRIIE